MRKTPKDVHIKISKHYSSIQANTNGKTVRDWLNGKSFKEQQEYGLQIWEQFMKDAGYAIN